MQSSSLSKKTAKRRYLGKQNDIYHIINRCHCLCLPNDRYYIFMQKQMPTWPYFIELYSINSQILLLWHIFMVIVVSIHFQMIGSDCLGICWKMECGIIISSDRIQMEKNALLVFMPNGQAINTSLISKDLCSVTIQEVRYENVLCFLFQNSIVFQIRRDKTQCNLQHYSMKIKFNFQLIFQARQELHTLSQQKSTHFIIQLERSNNAAILNFGTNKALFDIWRTELTARIKQRGFHSLFKAVKKIGKGNCANVYLVNKLQNQTKYAVKAFSKESIYNEEKGKESLIKQIGIMRQFNHKNLMRLENVYETDHSVYLVTEILQGGQLTQRIHKRLALLEVQLIMKSILFGLKCMHEAHIMHRDIKPENILFREANDYECVIVDFGLAESANNDYLFVRCGTPGYVAPEIVNIKDHNARYTCACDMFSLGIIFHMLMLKKSPFPGHQYDAVLQQNKALKFNFESPQYKQLSESTVDLLKRMLECDPVKRIAAAQALQHPFFNLQQSYSKSHTIKIESKHLKEQSASHKQECESPLMMSKNIQRKRSSNLRQDSCLKFKMKESLMTGSIEAGGSIEQINSPQLKRKRMGAIKPKSRFKRLANHS